MCAKKELESCLCVCVSTQVCCQKFVGTTLSSALSLNWQAKKHCRGATFAFLRLLVCLTGGATCDLRYAKHLRVTVVPPKNYYATTNVAHKPVHASLRVQLTWSEVSQVVSASLHLLRPNKSFFSFVNLTSFVVILFCISLLTLSPVVGCVFSLLLVLFNFRILLLELLRCFITVSSAVFLMKL